MDATGKLAYKKTTATEVVLARDGSVTVSFVKLLGGTPAKEVHGRATKDELAAVERAVAKAARGKLVPAVPAGSVGRGDQVALTTLGA